MFSLVWFFRFPDTAINVLHAQRLVPGPGSFKSKSGCDRTRQCICHGDPAAAQGAASWENRIQLKRQNVQHIDTYRHTSHTGTGIWGRVDRSVRSRSILSEITDCAGRVGRAAILPVLFFAVPEASLRVVISSKKPLPAGTTISCSFFRGLNFRRCGAIRASFLVSRATARASTTSTARDAANHNGMSLVASLSKILDGDRPPSIISTN